jgi:hypothetical protein
MVQCGGRFGFPYESDPRLGITFQLWGKEFDGDVPFEDNVFGKIYLTHAPFSKKVDNFEMVYGVSFGKHVLPVIEIPFQTRKIKIAQGKSDVNCVDLPTKNGADALLQLLHIKLLDIDSIHLIYV